jgi:hypothetical protein
MPSGIINSKQYMDFEKNKKKCNPNPPEIPL